MIELTQEAATHITRSFAEKGLPENSAVRFAVAGGGCSGFTLEVSVEPIRKFEMPRKSDVTLISNDVRIIVDKKSSLFIDGMVVGLQTDSFGHKLKFNNPNSKGVCGCGESFSI